MPSFRSVLAIGDSFTKRTGFRFTTALTLVLAYWCALILLDVAADGFNIHYNHWRIRPAELWVDRVVWFGAWMAVTPLVLVLLGTACRGPGASSRTLAVHVLGHPALIGLQVLLAASVFVLIGPRETARIADVAVRLFLTVTLGRDLHAYAALIAIFYAVSLGRQRFEADVRASRLGAESAELSRRLTEAKLDSLRRELNPHVLFNGLNSIGTLVRAGERSKAIRMLASMSTLLRAYLGPSREPVVSLLDELDLLDRYLDVERIRLEERLGVKITVDPGAMGALLPPFLLQPLVENAVKHGADLTDGSTLLSIDIADLDGRLRIDVVNESDPPPRQERQASGRPAVGLANVRRRLEMLYGGQAGLELEPRPSGARVRAWVPRDPDLLGTRPGEPTPAREAG